MASIEDLFAFWWIGIITVPLLALIIKALIEKYQSGNTLGNTSSPTSTTREEKFHCPRCGVEAREGFVLCGKGIIWADKTGKPIGLFTTIFRALETQSVGD
jgi:hypothetical protein